MELQNEVWKTIEGYNDIYEVSNLGRFKSKSRNVCNGKSTRITKEKISFGSKDNLGYMSVSMFLNKKEKKIRIHQLVAQYFLNHKINGYEKVIDHIDFNKQNNNVNNLRIVTSRQNSSYKEKKYTSNYVGVIFLEKRKKYKASININRKSKHLGYFNSEIEASNAYKKALSNLKI